MKVFMIATLLYTSLFSVLTNAAGPTESKNWVKGRILVQPKPGLSEEKMANILAGHGGKSTSQIPRINVHIIQVPEGAEKAVVSALSHNPSIQFAELDPVLSPTMATNDPYFSSEWHLAKTGTSTAWNLSLGSGVVVAVLDSGVLASHTDLAGQLVPGWNAYNNNSDTTDILGHGTAVAGTIIAAGNNSLGVVGMAFGAKVMPIRITDANGYATGSAIANALVWASDHGAKVANISYEGTTGNSTVITAADYMRNKGGLVVVAAGNSGTDLGTTNSSSLITVSATDSSDVITTWSSFGNAVDIAAPGYGILTTSWSGGYSNCMGTSFSAPIVAGSIALMMAANPSLPPTQIESILLANAVDLGAVGKDAYYGNGRLNSDAAVQAAVNAVANDTQAPSVSLASPLNGSIVKGTITVDVSASDNVGVSRVDLYVGGKLLASDSLAPFSFSWDSTTGTDGSVSIQAKAYDANGNTSSSSLITVNVDNIIDPPDTTLPVVTILSPTNNSTVKSNVSISASATDNVAVKSMSIYIDGTLKASSTSGAISMSWNTRKVSAGSHTIRIEAKDAAGNVGVSTISVKK